MAKLKIKTYTVFGILPRIREYVELYKAESLEDAEKFAAKQVKYFPKLVIKGGTPLLKDKCDTYEEVVENPGYVDRRRHVNPVFKIGKLKRRSRFQHTILYEDEKKIHFLVRFKKSQVRVCIIDANMKDQIQYYIAKFLRDWKVKIYRSALPLVYIRGDNSKHVTLMELVTGKKPAGYMIFKNDNPYDYRRENIVRLNRAPVYSNRPPKTKTGYYGVLKTKNGKYFASCSIVLKPWRGPVRTTALEAAKDHDRKMMEAYGRLAAKNFPYEYYKAFEPEYILNVQ